MRSLKEKLGSINRYKAVQVGDATINVYIPTASHMREIQAQIDIPSQEAIAAQMTKFAPLIEALVKTGEAVEIDGKVFVKVEEQNISVDQIARLKAQEELLIVAMFSLVDWKDGDDIFCYKYSDILDLLSEEQIKVYVAAIKEAVAPDYKTVLGN